jgi:hypothetical protein
MSVVVMQAMQNRQTDKLSLKLAWAGRQGWQGHGLSDPLVQSGVAEVAGIFRHWLQAVSLTRTPAGCPAAC